MGLKEYRLDNGELYAWMEITVAELDSFVPANFEKSNGSNKTFRQYSVIYKHIDKRKFILVGYHDNQGNRKDRITKKDFQDWLDYFPSKEFYNYEEAKTMMEEFSNIAVK